MKFYCWYSILREILCETLFYSFWKLLWTRNKKGFYPNYRKKEFVFEFVESNLNFTCCSCLVSVVIFCVGGMWGKLIHVSFFGHFQLKFVEPVNPCFIKIEIKANSQCNKSRVIVIVIVMVIEWMKMLWVAKTFSHEHQATISPKTKGSM